MTTLMKSNMMTQHKVTHHPKATQTEVEVAALYLLTKAKMSKEED
jgi:hypothetical protein